VTIQLGGATTKNPSVVTPVLEVDFNQWEEYGVWTVVGPECLWPLLVGDEVIVTDWDPDEDLRFRGKVRASYSAKYAPRKRVIEVEIDGWGTPQLTKETA
jgi:hypothetical protein